MKQTLSIGEIELFFKAGCENYCNTCRFRKYINHEMKHWCVLFREGLEKDGDNFIRLSSCHQGEVDGCVS